MSQAPFAPHTVTQFYDNIETCVYFSNQPKAQVPILAMLITTAIAMIDADADHYAKLMTNLDQKYSAQNNPQRRQQYGTLQIILGAVQSGLRQLND